VHLHVLSNLVDRHFPLPDRPVAWDTLAHVQTSVVNETLGACSFQEQSQLDILFQTQLRMFLDQLVCFILVISSGFILNLYAQFYCSIYHLGLSCSFTAR